MSERLETSLFGPEITAAHNFCEEMSANLFFAKADIDKELAENSASKLLVNTTKGFLLKHHNIVEKVNDQEAITIYRDYKSNFLLPLTKSLDISGANEQKAGYLLSLRWYSGYYCLDSAAVAAREEAPSDFYLVGFKNWHEVVVKSRLEGYEGLDIDDPDKVVAYLDNPQLYSEYIQWHAYSHSLAKGILEELLNTNEEADILFKRHHDISPYTPRRTLVGLGVEMIDRDLLRKFNDRLKEHGPESDLTKKAAARAFTYPADLRFAATKNMDNLIRYHPSNPA
ncbi:MAG: hypothetical protein WDZ32_00190 [Candidatus Saccharimonadales bacterium]